MKIIKIAHEKEMIVDNEDFEYLNQWKWNVIKGNYAVKSFRKSGKIITILAHRIILGLTDKNLQVDHINGNSLDNRRSNLRICTQSKNKMNSNKYKNNKSGFTGVYWHKRNLTWDAQISINKKQLYLGSYKEKQDAIRVRKQAVLRYYGEFAKL